MTMWNFYKDLNFFEIEDETYTDIFERACHFRGIYIVKYLCRKKYININYEKGLKLAMHGKNVEIFDYLFKKFSKIAPIQNDVLERLMICHW